jgi:putative heme transporter
VARHKGLKRSRGIGLVFVVLAVGALLLLAFTIPSLVDQVNVLVKEEPALRGRIADLLAQSGATAPLADSLRNVHYDALARPSAGAALAFSTRMVELVAYLLSAIFLALYIMIDRDRLRGGLFAVVPRTHHVRLSRVLMNLETIVGATSVGRSSRRR